MTSKRESWWSMFCGLKEKAKQTNQIVVIVGSSKESLYNSQIRLWGREDIDLCLGMENYHIGWC